MKNGVRENAVLERIETAKEKNNGSDPRSR